MPVPLHSAKRSTSKSWRFRAMQTDAQSLRDLLGRRPSRIELDRAALEIAKIEYPDLDADASISQLDCYALAIAERARDLSDGRNFVQSANEYLFGELGFRGNEEDYYNPANCCLNHVIDSKLGIPITLSIVYMEIARRLAKPVSGVGLPGHFVIRYDDPDYSAIIDRKSTPELQSPVHLVCRLLLEKKKKKQKKSIIRKKKKKQNTKKTQQKNKP